MNRINSSRYSFFATPRHPSIGLALGLSILLLACGGGGGSTPAPTPPPTPTVDRPAIANPVVQTAVVSGAAISLDLPNTGGAVTGCSVDRSGGKPDLPDGLSVAVANVGGKASCRVSGSVAASATPGMVNVSITAVNAAGSATFTVTFNIEATPGGMAPMLADAAAQSFTAGVEIAPVTFANAGGDVAADGCALAGGSTLPNGLMLRHATPAGATATCEIHGAPRAAAATATYTIEATGPGGTDTATVEITVIVPPPMLADAAAQSFTAGVEIAPVTFANTGGDVAADGCALAGGSTLPNGLMLRHATPAGATATCEIHGAPLAAAATATYTIEATGPGGTDTATIEITVADPLPPRPMLANAAPQSFTAGVEIAPVTFANTGGDVAADGCALAGGSTLPNGLMLRHATPAGATATCEIHGAPLAAVATATYTIEATGPGGTDTATVEITVSAAAQPMLANAAPQSFTAGVEIAPVTFANTGGDVAADGCALVGGSTLPNGLMLRHATPAGATATCEIHGAPLATAATATYTIEATNPGGTDTATIEITVADPLPPRPMLANAAPQSFTTGVEIAPVTFANTGGDVAADGCALAGGSTLPNGLMLRHATPAGATATCEIHGTPLAAVATATYTIEATGPGGMDVASVSITVVAAITMSPALTAPPGPHSFTIGFEITPITFANSGQDVAVRGCVVATGSSLPANLMLRRVTPMGATATCEIHGIPTGSPVTGRVVTIDATNVVGTTQATVTISTVQPTTATERPGLVDAAPSALTVGVQTSIDIVNNGGAVDPDGCGSQNLPNGLRVVAATPSGRTPSCRIVGAPRAVAATPLAVVVSGRNSLGTSMATITLTINPPMPQLSNILGTRSYVAGQDIASADFTNDGGDATRCEPAPGSNDLPNGLMFRLYTDSSGTASCQLVGRTDDIVSVPLTLTVMASNAGGNSTATVDITVLPPPPVLTAVGEQVLIIGTDSLSLTLVNTGGSADRCDVDTSNSKPALPPGLSLSRVTDNNGKGTCRIEGTVQASATIGSLMVAISASNASATVSSIVIPFTLRGPIMPPILADIANALSLQIDQAVSGAVFTNTGDAVDPGGCTLSAPVGEQVPQGLEARVVAGIGGKRSCELAGTPTEAVVTPLTLTVTGANSAGQDTATVTITAAPAAPALADIESRASLRVNQAVSGIDFVNSGGAVDTCAAATSGNALPAGLSFQPSSVKGVTASCALAGIPTEVTAATTLTVMGSNRTGSDTATVSVAVVPEPPVLGNIATLQGVEPSVAVSGISFANTGGAVSGCSLAPGSEALPTGLVFETLVVSGGPDTCQLTGMVTAAINDPITLTVQGSNDGGSGTATVTIATLMSPSLADIEQVHRLMQGVELQTPIAFTNTGGSVRATGGCALVEGDRLPDGLMVRRNSASPASCEIHGTPTSATIPARYTVVATGTGGRDTASVTIIVEAVEAPPGEAPSLADPTAVTLTIGYGIEPIRFTNTGGPVSATGCRVTTGTLPTGLMARRGIRYGLVDSCEIYGTPSGSAASGVSITLRATNAVGSDTATVSITTVAATVAASGEAPELVDAIGLVLSAGEHSSVDITNSNPDGPVTATGCTASASIPDGLEVTASAPPSGASAGCRVSGAVAEPTATPVTFTVTGSNAQGSSMATVSLAVLPRGPQLVSSARVNYFALGMAISPLEIANLGGMADYCELPSSYIGLGDGINFGDGINYCRDAGYTDDCPPYLLGRALPAGLFTRVSSTGSCEIYSAGNGPTEPSVPTVYRVFALNSGGASLAYVPISVFDANAPSLASIEGVQRLLVRQPVSGIVFENSGGNVAGGSCQLSAAAPQTVPEGLYAEVATDSDGTRSCALAGTPTEVVSTPITLTVTSAYGRNGISSATVRIIIELVAPELVDIAVARHLEAGRDAAGADIVFVNSGGSVMANGCTLTAAPGVVVPNGLSAAVVAGGEGPDSCGLAGTPTAATSGLLTLFVTARNALGEDTASVDVSITAPMPIPSLADIDDLVLLEIGEEASGVVFENSGGDVMAGGCELRPPSGSSLPSGLTAELVEDGDGTVSCALVGTPTAATQGSVALTVAATNFSGEDTATVRVSASEGTLAQALDTSLEISQSGAGGWRAQTAVTQGNGPDAAASGGADDEAGDSCLEAAVTLPGNYAFVWLGEADDEFEFSLEAGDADAEELEPISLPTVGEWASFVGEVGLGDSRDGVLRWCYSGEAGGVYLDTLFYNEAPVGLRAAAASATVVNLAWEPYPNASYYLVLQGTSTNPNDAESITATKEQHQSSLEVAGLNPGTTYHYWIRACDADACSQPSLRVSATPRRADSDGDGLLEIRSLADLDSVRNDLDGASLVAVADLPGNSDGCPGGQCEGYELTGSLDFDLSGDGQSWMENENGDFILDMDDRSFGRIFDSVNGGWQPLGDCGADGVCFDDDETTQEDESEDDAPFNAIFEGNGHSIDNLASVQGLAPVGLFGFLGPDAVVRRLSLGDALAVHDGGAEEDACVGLLAGRAQDSQITAVHASGLAFGSEEGLGHVGGLVGCLDGGFVTASSASGAVVGGAGAGAGGLIGTAVVAFVTASYADAEVEAGSYAGGLIGSMSSGFLSASYAIGDASSDVAGGLVGRSLAFIRASYSDGDAGSGDTAGSLVGTLTGNASSLTASWGFGSVPDDVARIGPTGSVDDANVDDRPSGVTAPRQLSATNAPAAWSQSTSSSVGAWDYGAATQAPALRYADYDGDLDLFHCASAVTAEAPAPDNAIIIPDCAASDRLLPGQRRVGGIKGLRLAHDTSGVVSLSWDADPNAAGYAVYSGTGPDPATATAVSEPDHSGTSISHSELELNTRYHYWVLACATSVCPVPSGESHTSIYVRAADADSNGLIEITSLEELDAMRNDLMGSSLSVASDIGANTLGCPAGGCRGYELTSSLSFDADGDGYTWLHLPNGLVMLDEDDHHPGYFDTADSGWLPIGHCGEDGLCASDGDDSNGDETEDNSAFAAVFDGRGQLILGLASSSEGPAVGLFGLIGDDAEIRNLGLRGNLAHQVGEDAQSAYAGGLAGYQAGGSITASYATGSASAGADQCLDAPSVDNIAAGAANAAGGLVGHQAGGSITASYATGSASAGADHCPQDQVSVGANAAGGLVGHQAGGSITASYAVGRALAGDGDGDSAGGLVGYQAGGSITASYATGLADAGLGDDDSAGSLIGNAIHAVVPVSGASASWGFGEALGEETSGYDGSDDLPSGVEEASDLTFGVQMATATNAPASWNSAGDLSLGAWGFGTDDEAPTLYYSDYDGPTMSVGGVTSGDIFHCASDAVNAADGAILVASCTSPATALPVQDLPQGVVGASVAYAEPTGDNVGWLAIDWADNPQVGSYRIWRARGDDPGNAALVSREPILTSEFTDYGVDEGASYYYWIQSCVGRRCSGLEPLVSAVAHVADADGNGLIEIGSLLMLHNVRHDLDGASYRIGPDSLGSSTGCPAETGCFGYELSGDLDFDADGSGGSWEMAEDGFAILDEGDHHDVYFDTAGDGWLPIGDCGPDGLCVSDGNDLNGDETKDNRPFTATFDGAGYSIANLATSGAFEAIGLFGHIGEGADIRSLSLEGGLAEFSGEEGGVHIGALVGFQAGGHLVACRADSVVIGGGRSDDVGGLVGLALEGNIAASSAVGEVYGQGGGDNVGGLVGHSDSIYITATWSDAISDGGDGADIVGGLIGRKVATQLSASYAVGGARGGNGNNDIVGGLVGSLVLGPHGLGPHSRVTGAFSAGFVNGGAGLGDRAGSLVGQVLSSSRAGVIGFIGPNGNFIARSSSAGTVSSLVLDNHGFAVATGEESGIDNPFPITRADFRAGLSVSWDNPLADSAGAWSLSETLLDPNLAFADYDGIGANTGQRYHCANDAENAPEGAVLVPHCATEPVLLPGQDTGQNPGPALVTAAVTANGTATITWRVQGFPVYRVFRADSAELDEATEVSDAAGLGASPFTDTSLSDGVYYYWTLACEDARSELGNGCEPISGPVMLRMRMADADADGLIEIFTAAELDMMRYDLAGSSLKPSAGVAGLTSGCPVGGCFGYELEADIDFDLDGDGVTWRATSSLDIRARPQNLVPFTLDPEDWAPHFDTDHDGWAPVGPQDSSAFTGTFEGNGFVIRNLAVTGNAGGSIGLFGYLGENSEVRNLGLVNNLAWLSGSPAGWAGGIAGHNSGNIIATYTTGHVHVNNSGAGTNRVGGLVGSHAKGLILACFASGNVTAEANNKYLSLGALTSDVQPEASIVASYATGRALSYGFSADDGVGGLVGWVNGSGTVTASYATGDSDADRGSNSYASRLIGANFSPNITDSWGFGAFAGLAALGSHGSGNLPEGVSGATDFAAANAPDSWNQASSSTLGAWDFGTATQTPALRYADYDGPAGNDYHCANDATPPDGATLIAHCSSESPVLIPNQRPLPPPLVVSAASTSAVTVSWRADASASFYRVFAADDADGFELASPLTTGDTHTATTLSDTDVQEGDVRRYWVQSCNARGCNRAIGPVSIELVEVDGDNDGLIDIVTARQLHNARHHLDGAGYGESPAATNTIGCPASTGCFGYELTANIDFDEDGDGYTWTVDGGGVLSLDDDDADAVHFDTGEGGWLPIGDCGPDGECVDLSDSDGGDETDDNAPFEAVFDGGGHTISHLATAREAPLLGLFGLLGEDADIRNLRLVDNLAYSAGDAAVSVGGLAGRQAGGTITASYTTGPAYGGDGDDAVGALVGRLVGGEITASFASGDAHGGGGGDSVGSLVGYQDDAAITASYASGDADGGDGDDDAVGALVGTQGDSATITASYASGDADGGDGDDDFAGALVGARMSSTVVSAWGFGEADGEEAGFSGASNLPQGVSAASQLTDENVPSEWDSADSSTLGAWDLGSASQEPALNYADYDGATMAQTGQAPTSGHLFHCASDSAQDPEDAIIIRACDTSPLIPDQREGGGVRIGFSYTAPAGQDDAMLELSWVPGVGVSGWRLLRNTTPSLAGAKDISGVQPFASPSFTDDDVVEGAAYYYWLRACDAAGCREPGPLAGSTLALTADDDGNGLIEIATALDLHNIRHALNGAGYASEPGGLFSTIGCPADTGCFGYELSADIDFDGDDADSTSWTRAIDGSLSLDEDDHHPDYFDVSAGGWLPIGHCGADGVCGDASDSDDADESADDAPFTAIFDGAGYSIANLAVLASHRSIGLFGHVGEGADISGLGLTGALLANDDSLASSFIGGLAGYIDDGSITASYAAVRAQGGVGNDDIGGLVGSLASGAITASYATVRLDGGAGADRIGGLIGHHDAGTVAASYATGHARGGDTPDVIGGLIGVRELMTVTASWANVSVEGGAGDDLGAKLIGRNFATGSVTASWGFGDVLSAREGDLGLDASNDLPTGVMDAGDITSGVATATDAPGSWDSASDNTKGAWGFGSTTQAPALLYADYDGDGDDFHCASAITTQMPAPDGAIIVPGCDGSPALIPGQRMVMPVETVELDYTAPSGSEGAELSLSWATDDNADGYRVWRGTSGDSAQASLLGSATSPTYTDSNVTDGAAYYYWITACLGTSCSALGEPIITLARTADADGDGLIEVSSLAELHNVRHNLAGTSYCEEAGGVATAIGCPGGTCHGYELTADLDFDGDDADTTAWTRDGSTSVITLDSDDSVAGHFDTSAGGWLPIGHCGEDGECLDDFIPVNGDEEADNHPFIATFDGGGNTIANLAVSRDLPAVGLFGLVGEGAVIHSLHLDNALADFSGQPEAATGSFGKLSNVGALAGMAIGVNIAGVGSTGYVEGDFGSPDNIGGLVGHQFGGTITSSFSTAEVRDPGGLRIDAVGGLIGFSAFAALRACYSTGDVHAGDDGNGSSGGLVGLAQANVITASYSASAVSAGAGAGDFGGTLVGSFQAVTFTHSYGLGTVSGHELGGTFGSFFPRGVSTASGLSSSNVPGSWNSAASGTSGAWDFGTSTDNPTLMYADHDGLSTGFHCSSEMAPATKPLILFTSCATALPGQ